MPSRLSRIRNRTFFLGVIGGIIVLLVVGLYVWCGGIRVDLTADKRYSLKPTTITFLQRSLKDPIQVTLYLSETPNAGFRRLQRAVKDLVVECKEYADIRFDICEPTDSLHLTPTMVYERTRSGASVSTPVYPYIAFSYHGRTQLCNLLHNDGTLSGAENLNRSIEELEFLFVNTIHSLTTSTVRKVAFLTGHHEASEKEVYDFTNILARYFEVDRGSITNDATILDDYAVIIIVTPKQPFSDQEKYILDQYVMRGGTILWIIDGVQFKSSELSKTGFTPILVPQTNIAEMLFRYGVRVEAAVIQDMQCLNVPVNMSTTSGSNFQPMPWTFAPLLLTCPTHPITRNIPQVLGTFVSPISAVGEADGLHKTMLLCSSNHTRVTSAPGEVDLVDFTQAPELFTAQYMPIAVLIEGIFPSLFTHRLPPDGLTNVPPFFKQSVPTKQVVVASGSIACNEWQENVALPMGYDRYTKRTFGNQEFLINTILYLSGDEQLLSLRQRVIDLRVINTTMAQRYYGVIQLVTIIVPILLLSLVAIIVTFCRRKKYLRL